MSDIPLAFEVAPARYFKAPTVPRAFTLDELLPRLDNEKRRDAPGVTPHKFLRYDVLLTQLRATFTHIYGEKKDLLVRAGYENTEAMEIWGFEPGRIIALGVITSFSPGALPNELSPQLITEPCLPHPELAGKSVDSYAMLKEVYGNECLSRTPVFEWFKRFKEGRKTTEDDPRPVWPSTSKTNENIEKTGKLIREDRRLSIRGLSELTGIDKECVCQIWHESFNVHKVCAKIMPKLVIPEMSQSKFKPMMIVFFDIRYIIYVHWVPEGQTINQHYYIEVLTALRERVIRRRPDLWKTKSWKIHPDNAPAHSALSVKAFFAKYGITVMEHPPYSPTCTPPPLNFLFRKVKSALKETRFKSVEAVKAKGTEVLNHLTEADCFQQWKNRMERCRDRQGEYIDGEKVATRKLPTARAVTWQLFYDVGSSGLKKVFMGVANDQNVLEGLQFVKNVS
ncbi:hypothetical protein NQ318_006921 [Aromia moschata]|uniref:Mos1 transposase HTH domain-containing protein n=1 Tax=Aromia moschata TaxID=1265417 RepID=A0AAV8YLC6_9CUCU|nr:hypothetical protein NQ318_006921 [Aromia moschata]